MEQSAAKKACRQQLRAQRSALSFSEVQNAGLKILQHLQNHPRWQKAQRIGAYMAMRGEPATHELCSAILNAGQTLALPRVATSQTLSWHQVYRLEDLVSSSLDILEPQATAPRLSPLDFDILLIPGVGFDSAGHRLGQGGGFYDRLLADLPNSTWRLGHAHQFQVLAQLPVEPHDEKVHAIVTPNGIIDITTV